VRLTRARLGFLLFALAVNLISAGTLNMRSAYACSCAGTATLTEELEASDAVFSVGWSILG
jgi:hypothetical protein